MTPFTISTNNITNLGMTLTKQVKDLYDKNFKTLKKEFEEDLRGWIDLSCSWIGRANIVKMAILLKAIYRHNAIPIKIPNQFFMELENQSANFFGITKYPGQQKLFSTTKEILGKSPCLISSSTTEQ